MHSLGKILFAFACFILYLKAKLACYSRYLLTSYICIPFPYDEKDTIFCVLVLKDLNQIPYHYTVEVTNRFKGLDLIDRVPEELWTEIMTLYRRQ